MELDPVVAHFESVADVYDEVLPFFSGFHARRLSGSRRLQRLGPWTSPPGVELSPRSC